MHRSRETCGVQRKDYKVMYRITQEYYENYFNFSLKISDTEGTYLRWEIENVFCHGYELVHSKIIRGRTKIFTKLKHRHND